MENSLKALLITSGLIITCSVLRFGFILFDLGNEMFAKTHQSLQADLSWEKQKELYAYDAMVLYGSTVSYVAQKYVEEPLGYGVVFMQKTKWYCYECKDQKRKAVSPGIEELLKDLKLSACYRVTVLTGTEEKVIGFLFTKLEEE